MYQKLQSLIAGILIGTTLTGGVVFAQKGSEWIEAIYSDIQVHVNGVNVALKDANGSTVEPFIHDGTTYLPIRAIGQALGKQISWDGLNKIVHIGEAPDDVLSLTEVCPPYDGKDYEIHKSSDGQYVTIAGNKYTDILTLGGNYDKGGNALFNLNAQYNTLTFEIGRIDTSRKKENGTLNIYLDGKLYNSYEVYAEDLPKRISIDLNNALQMKLELLDCYGSQYGFINAIIE